MGLKGVANKGKGKAVADTESSGGKRKRASNGKDNSTGGRRRTDRRVLRFFEDTAEESDSDGSDIGDGERFALSVFCLHVEYGLRFVGFKYWIQWFDFSFG